MAGRRSAGVGQRHLDAPRDLRLRAAAAPHDAPHDRHRHGPLLAPGREMFSEMRRVAMPAGSLAQLATGTKSVERNALIRSRRLNEWGLHAARVALAYPLAPGPPPPPPPPPPPGGRDGGGPRGCVLCAR